MSCCSKVNWPSSTISGGDYIAREIVTASSDTRTVLPLLGNCGVKIVASVVGALTHGEEEVVAEIERPAGSVVVPQTPFDRGSEVEFTNGGRAQAIEINANFDLPADAHHHARCVREEGLGRLCGAVKFTIDLALVEDVGAGNVEDGFLREYRTSSDERK